MNVSKRQFKGHTWNILSRDKNTDFFDIISKKNYTVKHTLKEHHRSLVYQIDINGRDYVLKIPVEKNTRKWIRFTTLFRDSEAFRNFRGMLKYGDLDIPTTTPVLAAEKRVNGMVTDSWLLYEYLYGKSCLDREDYYPMAVETLKSIHTAGYLHGDPQIRNFMYSEGRIYVIDSNPRRSGISGFSKAYEFAYLRRSAPGIEKYFGRINLSWMYRLACYYDRYERKFVRTKRKVKWLLLLKN